MKATPDSVRRMGTKAWHALTRPLAPPPGNPVSSAREARRKQRVPSTGEDSGGLLDVSQYMELTNAGYWPADD